MAVEPADRVFTTVPYDGEDGLLDPASHLARLSAHAARLGIEVPGDLVDRIAALLPDARRSLADSAVEALSSYQPPALLRIEVERDGEVRLAARRPQPIADPAAIKAVAHPAPRFPAAVMGTKHAAWAPYDDARRAARQAAAEVALLVADDAIVDGDRAAPLLLDHDGVAYRCRTDGGGVDSLTSIALSSALEEEGMPMREARLTRRMVARAADLIVVGSGIGVARIVDIDGQPVGTEEPSALYDACARRQARRLATGWSGLGEVEG